MKYFSRCRTVDELKAEYRQLAKIHHPDMGGDVATMQAINNEYEEGFERLNSSSSQPKNESAAEFITVIDALMRIHGITIKLCGSWLWISGNTRPVKEELKAAGCRWASKKSQWYWHPSDQPLNHRRTNTSMQEIRSKYGSRIISQREDELRTA